MSRDKKTNRSLTTLCNVDYIDIDKLTPDPNNTRIHGEFNIAAIRASLEEFGQHRPFVVQRGTNKIVVGNGMYFAAKQIGLKQVPVIWVDDDNITATRRAIADNRTPELAEWDERALYEELKKFEEMGLDRIPGFEDFELESLKSKSKERTREKKQIDLLPDFDSEKALTKPGDIWILGRNRLICGDSCEWSILRKLLDGVRPTFIFTDPPYGQTVLSKQGAIGQFGRTYKAVEGDDSNEIAIKGFRATRRFKARIEIWWGGNFYADTLPPSRCWLCWYKVKDWQRVDFADCELAWTNLDKPARVFHHIWSGFKRDSEENIVRVHPTQKPVALTLWALDDYAEPTDVCFDGFAGSGSTLIACEEWGIPCYAAELDPYYCDVIAKRWERITGEKAELVKGEK